MRSLRERDALSSDTELPGRKSLFFSASDAHSDGDQDVTIEWSDTFASFWKRRKCLLAASCICLASEQNVYYVLVDSSVTPHGVGPGA